MRPADRRRTARALARWRRRGGKTALGREEAEAVVSPVIGQALLFEMTVVGVVVHGHQLDRSDAEVAQMLDRWLCRQRLVRTALMLRNSGMELREAFDMH